MATLHVDGTSLGNLEDMTFRAVRLLREAAVLACEDTRVTRKLLSHFEIPRPKLMFAVNDRNEANAAAGVRKLLDEGRDVVLVSDAGMPAVSDPGYRVVGAALDGGHKVEVAPGPSAVTTALVASGLPPASFTFLGFPPRKPGARKRLLERHGTAEPTMILFESPHRLGALLADARDVLGDRPAAVAFELTKMFERVDRGRLGELAARYEGRTERGEITVVIAGRGRKDAAADADEPED